MNPDDRSELLEQAHDYLRAPGDHREDASAWTLNVARSFRERNAAEQRGAPRLANLRKQIGAIEKHAAQLVYLLGETDPYFAQAAAGYLGIDDWMDDQGASNFFEIMDLRERTQLTAKLQRLASLANRLGQALPRDTGGQHDLRGIFEGPATWSLAVDCWELFDWFRPGEATGYVDGDYHRFVAIVFELGVQESPNDYLGTVTQRAARRCRTYAERTPGYRNLHRALPPGNSPAGLLTGSGIAADLYDVPAKLRDEIVPRKRHR